MFSGLSAPPAHSGVMWSTWYPGQAPRVRPVAGQGFSARKARTWARSRSALASAFHANAVNKSRAACSLALDEVFWGTRDSPGIELRRPAVGRYELMLREFQWKAPMEPLVNRCNTVWRDVLVAKHAAFDHRNL